MWSSVKGVVGLAKTAVEYSVAGTAFVYGKVTGKMPKWAEKRMGNAKEFAKKVWQDPFSILEGMGQGLSDTYENEGVSYLAGAFVGDYLIAKGATKAVKAMKKPKSGKKVSGVGGKYSTKIDSKVVEVEKANLPDFIKSTYVDGYYRTVETLEDVKVYRTYGGKANQSGGYATTSPATTRIDSKIDTALLPEWGNSRKYEIEITIPNGQQLNIGKVAPQTIESTGTVLSGGVDQILLPQGWPSEWITDTRIVPSK